MRKGNDPGSRLRTGRPLRTRWGAPDRGASPDPGAVSSALLAGPCRTARGAGFAGGSARFVTLVDQHFD